MENFWSTLKIELVYRTSWRTRDEAENAIFATATPGTYQVRVRTTSACGLPETGWHVRILRHTTVIADLSGASFASGVDAPGGGPTGTGQVAATFAIGP